MLYTLNVTTPRGEGMGHKLFFDMTTFSFSAEYATKYGLEEAVMIQNLEYWICKNAANGRHFHDGRYWTYNTAEAFTKLFPFWNPKKIWRVLQSLIDQGVILTGEYNDSPYDHTKWYAFTDTFQESGKIEFPKMENRDSESEKSSQIYYQNTNPPYSPVEYKYSPGELSPQGAQAHEEGSALFDNDQAPQGNPTPKFRAAPSPKKDFSDSDFIAGLIEAGVTEQTARDWVKQRKKQGGVSSATSLKLVLNQFGLVPNVPPEEIVLMAIEKSWRGIKAEWYLNAKKAERPAQEPPRKKVLYAQDFIAAEMAKLNKAKQ